jgi:hypothetical protein
MVVSFCQSYDITMLSWSRDKKEKYHSCFEHHHAASDTLRHASLLNFLSSQRVDPMWKLWWCTSRMGSHKFVFLFDQRLLLSTSENGNSNESIPLPSAGASPIWSVNFTIRRIQHTPSYSCEGEKVASTRRLLSGRSVASCNVPSSMPTT